MDPIHVEPLRILKKFFDDLHNKLVSPLDESLFCLTLDHVLCLFKGLKLFHDFENQPYDAINITSSEQSKFYYDLRCLLTYTKGLKHLKLVPGNGRVLNPMDHADLSEFVVLRTLEIKSIPYTMVKGLNSLHEVIESITFHRCGVPSIKAVLCDSNGTLLKRSPNKEIHPSWRNLKILKLKNNKIDAIDETINMAQNIEVIDLSYNRIKSSNSSLKSLHRLESIFLNFNSVTSLRNFFSTSMTSVVQLSVSYNFLQSLEGVENLVNLRELDVSYNLIMTADNILQLKSLKSLEKLYICGNPLCMDKNYKSSVILKLHPAVIDQIVLDGRKLSKGDKKMFMSKFDSPENPVPVIGHDEPSQSIRSSNVKMKPKIISEIPDQTNFEDNDLDFFLSDSTFYASHNTNGEDKNAATIHRNDIINHFQETHEHFKPSFSRNQEQPKPKLATFEKIHERRDRDVDLLLGNRDPVVNQKEKTEEHQTIKHLDSDELIEASMDSMTAVQIKVQVVIERSYPGYQEESKVTEEDSTESIYEDPSNTLDKSDTSIYDTSIYFDAEQSPVNPSTDRAILLHKRSRVTMRIPKLSDPRMLTHEQIFRADAPNLKPMDHGASRMSDSTDQRMQKGCLGHSLFLGMKAEDQAMLQKDLSEGERVFPVTIPTMPSLKLACIVRGHWLLVVYGNDLPRLNIRENFDLKALKKIAKVRGGEKSMGLEFDTLQKHKRERVFTIEGDTALYEEFVELLKRFIIVLNQKMLECLKCGQVFEDRSSSSPSSQTHSSELQLKAKKALAKQKEKEKQACPQCLSGMIIETTRKPQGGGKSNSGASWVFDVITKQLHGKDFGPIEDMLNKSLSSEMGFVEETSTSELTSSGTYGKIGSNRKFIGRGVIDGDDDIKYYVDEEGQEAV